MLTKEEYAAIFEMLKKDYETNIQMSKSTIEKRMSYYIFDTWFKNMLEAVKYGIMKVENIYTVERTADKSCGNCSNDELKTIDQNVKNILNAQGFELISLYKQDLLKSGLIRKNPNYSYGYRNNPRTWEYIANPGIWLVVQNWMANSENMDDEFVYLVHPKADK